MKLKSLLVALLVLEACVPPAKKSSPMEVPSLSISGGLLFAHDHGPTNIFIEDETVPVVTTSDTHFSLEISNEKLEAMRHAHGGTNGPIRLYFITEGVKFVAVSSSLRYTDRGAVDLGVIGMLPEITLIGTVSANNPISGQLTSIADATVKVGRNEAKTNADGEFEIKAPQDANLPFVLEKAEFVRSKGTWRTENEGSARNLRLYRSLEPVGEIEFGVSDRSLRSTLNLMVAGNAMSRYVRFAANAEDLSGTASSTAPWMSVDEVVALPFDFTSVPTIYYQFADESRTTIGPILTLESPLSVE